MVFGGRVFIVVVAPHFDVLEDGDGVVGQNGLREVDGADVVAVDGFNQSIDLLLAGRIDGTFNDSLSYYDFATKKPDAKLKIAASQSDVDASGILVRKGETSLVAALNKALADLKADGTYAKLSQKYFGADVSR